MRHDEKLAFLACLNARLFAGREMQRVVFCVAVLGDFPGASEDKSGERAAERDGALRSELIERARERVGSEVPKALRAHARSARDLEPLESVRIHETRFLQALLRILDAASVGVFPHRLEAILPGAALVVVREVLAGLEASALGERLHRNLALLFRDVAAAARRTDLHRELDRVFGRGLRAVRGAFREVA